MSRRTIRKKLREYWAKLGPGLTTGAAGDDPAGIATYSQAGAKYGFQLIWAALFTLPFVAVIQEMCARIGLVSGRGLAGNIRKHYPPSALYAVATLLFVANVLNIAADLGAMAAGTRLLFPQFSSELLVVAFAFVTLLLQIFTSYAQYARYLKYLTLALLSYVVVAFAVDLDWSQVLYHTLVPSITFSRDQIFLLVAILGATVSPYLFFWQTAQEVEEGVEHGNTSITSRQHDVNPEHVRAMRTDVWTGMTFSNVVTFFIFAACAGTLYASGVTDIATADQAALALQPFGQYAYVLFVVGIVGTGLLAVPVLAASSAYAISESFGWRYGLYRTFKHAHAFYGVIIASVIVGSVANFLNLDPIKGLIYAAVVNGIIAPFILFFVVRISSNTHVMGEYANSRTVAAMGWITIGVMAVSGTAALLTFVV